MALDTSGYGSRMDFARVVKEVDLVMFSIKHPSTRKESPNQARTGLGKLALLSRVDGSGMAPMS